MADRKNVLVFIHGMVTTSGALSYSGMYDCFFRLMQQKEPILGSACAERIHVEWGYQVPGTPS